MLLKCPKCKSSSITQYMGAQFGKYECKECKYAGSFILEEHGEEKIGAKRKKRRRKNNLLVVSSAIILFMLMLYTLVNTATTGEKPNQIFLDNAKVKIVSDSKSVEVFVEVTDNFEERIKGLMFRERLDKDSGMLFIFEAEQIRSFWMKNTLISLDILFIDEDFFVIDIKENATPCKKDPCQRYSSKSPAKYVLEVNAGFVKLHNIELGSKIKIMLI